MYFLKYKYKKKLKLKYLFFKNNTDRLQVQQNFNVVVGTPIIINIITLVRNLWFSFPSMNLLW